MIFSSINVRLLRSNTNFFFCRHRCITEPFTLSCVLFSLSLRAYIRVFFFFEARFQKRLLSCYVKWVSLLNLKGVVFKFTLLVNLNTVQPNAQKSLVISGVFCCCCTIVLKQQSLFYYCFWVVTYTTVDFFQDWRD